MTETFAHVHPDGKRNYGMGCKDIAYGDCYFEMCSVIGIYVGTLFGLQVLKHNRI